MRFSRRSGFEYVPMAWDLPSVRRHAPLELSYCTASTLNAAVYQVMLYIYRTHRDRHTFQGSHRNKCSEYGVQP
jgi:hypothetical protein